MTSAPRFQHIDALRGIAALSVVFSHAVAVFCAFEPASERKFVLQAMSYLNFGQFGVFLFFLISGFVIPFSLRGGRGEGLRAFALSRFFRLYPLYWASMTLALLVMQATGIATGEVSDPFQPKILLLNATMTQAFFGAEGLQTVYWSLHPEQAFYLLCAALFGFGLLRRPGMILAAGAGLLGLAALSGLGATWVVAVTRLGFTDLLALGFMMLGLLARLAFVEKQGGTAAFFALLALSLVGLPVIEALAKSADPANAHPLAEGLIETASIFSAVALFFWSFRFAGRTFGLLRWLGDISYSLYLLHLPVLLLLEKFVSPHFAGAPLVFHFLLALPAVLGIAALANRFIEKPMIAEGRRLASAEKTSFVAEVAAT